MVFLVLMLNCRRDKVPRVTQNFFFTQYMRIKLALLLAAWLSIFLKENQ